MTQADPRHSTPPTNTSADTPIERPAASAGGFYVKTPETPEEAFQAIGRLRKEARDEIERLIQFLDETDNHMEREPDDEGDDADNEPSLGSFERMANQDKAWRTQSMWAFPPADGEVDDCDREDSDPDEAKQQPAEMEGVA